MLVVWVLFAQATPVTLCSLVPFAMSQPTQLDTPCSESGLPDEEWQEKSLPIAVLEPSPKKPRLEIGPRDCSRDRIKWIPCPTGSGLVPFVRNADTQVVHSGRCQMEVVKAGAVATHVQCLSGCAPEGCGAQCTCLCHLPREYYHERLLH